MKLNLLLATSLLTGAAFGQFTQANEPTIGNTRIMYVLDSNAVNYATATATWDYSTTIGYPNSSKTVLVVDATTTANASNYAGATKAIEIPGFTTSYFSSTASDRSSQGYVFETGPGQTVQVRFDANPAKLMNYPYALTNTLTDTYSGDSQVPVLGSAATSGTITTTVDGTGTLKLNATTTLNNITRFKIVDNATATTLAGPVVVERVQYEYYDLSVTTNGLPVFVHSNLKVTSNLFNLDQTLVMSSVAPDEYLALSKNNKATFGVYPNPANESVLISGLSGNETVSIIDMAGRTILTAQNAGTSQSFNVSDVQAGIYTVVVLSNGNATTKKLTIN
ncbi:T9SS type A sorting domain-containing protein [Fluviicola taffensis]|uniref:Secretion system C-terminal sorting domain-containing protein n=1 Tax=Fluviicola taffensis (strain DSM 16823 / NCIMB 13979 / RW262) TaxID=755732 RepID=F2IID9_FLUTR|nr:T9SS type A sorting domain-containing protein [Fluviicola taffensis]AEA44865.1 hypothetical protein Fluta_2886 [Fluviicola taffensis DSM 16823]